MKLGVPRQIEPEETRAPLVPAVVKKLVAMQIEVVVESGAGVGAMIPDAAYTRAGARVVGEGGAASEGGAAAGDDEPGEVWSQSQVVVTLRPPTSAQAEALPADAVVLGLFAPLSHQALIERLAQRRITTISMEFVPRISRAQSMDVLSSQANIAGYKAVILGAHHCPKMFPMMITAAGTVAPAKVFVLGAGVAGLQAIATAKRLGAVVEAYDVRPATKEQVQSLGGRFVEMPGPTEEAETSGGYASEQSAEQQQKQSELMAKHVTGADVVITTAAVFGKAPPQLVPADVARRMSPGSVIVDMAASPEHGRGNCELTRPGEVAKIEVGGETSGEEANGSGENAGAGGAEGRQEAVGESGEITIVGTTNLPALVPVHASQVYANNMHALLKELIHEGELKLNLEDAVQKGAVITHGGEITNEMVRSALQPSGASAESV